MSEVQQFEKWYQSEKKNGLVDIKYVQGDGIGRTPTREDFAAENNFVNGLIAQNKTVSRPDVF